MGAARKLITFGPELTLCEPARRIARPSLAEVIELSNSPAARRQNIPQQNRRATAPKKAGTPLTIFGAALQVWVRSDFGSPTSALWRDQSGNGSDFAAAGAQQPTFSASDATLGGRPTFTGNGTTNIFTNVSYVIPNPGTTPTYYWAIIKQVSNTASACVMGTTNHGIYTGALASPGMQQVAGVLGPANNGAAVGAWVCMEAQFNNAITDFLRLGSVEVSTVATGTNGGAMMCLFAFNGAAGFGNYAIAEVAVTNVTATMGQRNAMKAYGQSIYTGVGF